MGDDPELLSTEQAARELGISRRRIRQLLSSGRVVGARQVGRWWIIPSPVQVVAGKRGPKPKRERRPAP